MLPLLRVAVLGVVFRGLHPRHRTPPRIAGRSHPPRRRCRRRCSVFGVRLRFLIGAVRRIDRILDQCIVSVAVVQRSIRIMMTVGDNQHVAVESQTCYCAGRDRGARLSLSYASGVFQCVQRRYSSPQQYCDFFQFAGDIRDPIPDDVAQVPSRIPRAGEIRLRGSQRRPPHNPWPRPGGRRLLLATCLDLPFGADVNSQAPLLLPAASQHRSGDRHTSSRDQLHFRW